MQHEIVIIGSDGEQLLGRDIQPEQLFDMYASAALRLERVETALAQTAMLLLHHLGEVAPPRECEIGEVVADLQATLVEIHDVMQAAQRARAQRDFLKSRE